MAFKRSFFRWRLAHLLFWLRFFVLCFIQHFYHFFHKTSVNAQPLSPPFFEEIAAHKKNVFSHFCVCVCVFSIFHIFVDFRVPLADPLGQIGSILDRFWCHFWSNFPAFSAARAELLQRLSQETSQETCRELAEN